MRSRLVNVRLDERRVQKARRLRARGITLSDLVREAIDREYEQIGALKRGDVASAMREIYKEHPDPPDLPPRGYDVHNRDQARSAILGKLSRRS